MTGKRCFVFMVVMLLSVRGLAEDLTPSKIVEKVKAAYKSLETYKAQGTITSDIDTRGTKMKIEKSFAMILQKPNRYLISWTQKNALMPGRSQSGAVWSDGRQPYLYMGMMKQSKDRLKTSQLKGSSSELHTHISSPKLKTKDFQFALPTGTVLKESLFGGALEGKQ